MIDTLVECLVCGGKDMVPFLDLGEIPLANSFLKSVEELAIEKRFPLRVCYCSECYHVQLKYAVSPSEIFSEYIYFTGNSESVVSHARELSRIAKTNAELDRGSLVVEIGSNDGTVLEAFKSVSSNVLGIEPAYNVVSVAEERGIPTLAEFFNEELGERLSRTYGKAAIIIGRNVLGHVPALRGFGRGIAYLLADDGLVLIEVPYLIDLLEHTEFDTIYHEHLSYFSVTALDTLFKAVGLELINVSRIHIHGGSLLLQIQKQGGPRGREDSVESFLMGEAESKVVTPGGLETFAIQVKTLKDEIREFVRTATRSMRVAGYGASAKGNVMMNVCSLGQGDVEFIVDRNAHKHGLFTPGTGIPVCPVDKLYEGDIDCLLLLAWNFADEIIRQQKRFETKGGKFAIPIPHPQFISGADIGRPELEHLRSSGTVASRAK